MNIPSRSIRLSCGTHSQNSVVNLDFAGFFGRKTPSGFCLQRSWQREAADSISAVSDFDSAQRNPDGVDSDRNSIVEKASSTPRQRLEAVVLMSREPISPRKLVQLADLADATQARTLARQLNDVYDADGHAFRIEEIAGGYIVLTRPQFARWLRKLERVKPEEHHSQSSIETLAIVAYRQPVLRADIEAIRGVGCDEVLRHLMQRDLVRICGRSEELGRPYLYGTTKSFLQLFGLRSLDRLPRSDWVRQAEVQFENQPTDNTQPSDSFSSEV